MKNKCFNHMVQNYADIKRRRSFSSLEKLEPGLKLDLKKKAENSQERLQTEAVAPAEEEVKKCLVM